MSDGRAPRTDAGTVLLHGALTLAFVLAATTGLRIAADDPACWRLVCGPLMALDPVLPADNLWRDHMLAALVLVPVMAAYAVYLRAARLGRRVALDGARLAVLANGIRTAFSRRPGKALSAGLQTGNTRAGRRAAWGALGVVLLWLLYASMLALAVTGVMLYFGAGQFVLAIHLAAGLAAIAFPFAHVATHVRLGGLAQLLRIVRPTSTLPEPPPSLVELLCEELDKADRAESRDPALAASHATSTPAPVPRRAARLQAHPLASACAAALGVLVLAGALEGTTRPVLVMPAIQQADAPVLDGDLADPVWALSQPVSVLTTQGANFGGSGESLVEIRAVHDREYAYFAFVWEDPTRSLKHLPLVKQAGQWYLAQERYEEADETAFHEDKFAVLLSRANASLLGAAIHLTRKAPEGGAAGRTGRGLHYTMDGSIADLWHWKAAQGGLIGTMDNEHIGPLASPSAAQAAGTERYTGGLGADRGAGPYADNFDTLKPGDLAGPLIPRRLPRQNPALVLAMARAEPNVDIGEPDGAQWWLNEADSIPYSPAADARIPDGTVIPGVLITAEPTLGRAEIRCAAKWASGRWTLEVRRRLDTGRREDVAIRSGVLMWVAAFDHAQTRHTRHLRPIRLEVE